MQLIACDGCARHVRADEGSCPFCGAAVDASAHPPRPAPPAGLGRAAVFLFGAAISGTAVGCGSIAPAYGVPPEDGGVAADGGADAGGPAPAYGAVPIDAGFDGGGGGALYGGAPIDGG